MAVHHFKNTGGLSYGLTDGRRRPLLSLSSCKLEGTMSKPTPIPSSDRVLLVGLHIFSNLEKSRVHGKDKMDEFNGGGSNTPRNEAGTTLKGGPP
ncbi:hypothetical protein HAX54_047272, partial [Datura stramonium]|nr:hypothetical protein [Datura stramonium]